MPIELYIGDELLDLKPNEVIAVTRQINDIADVSKIKADGSNQFKLPKTANNRRILENAGEVTSLTNMPYQLSNAKVIQDGIELMHNGKMIVEKSDDYYHVQVASGNKNFFDLIEGKTLKDLDLSDYDHEWSLGNALASRTYTEGYIYPVIDMGNLKLAINDFDIRYQLPTLFVHTIWHKIAEEAGFEWSGDFLESDIFKNLLFFYNQGKNPKNSQQYAANQLFSATAPGGVYDNNITFKVDFTSINYDPGSNFSLPSDRYVVPATGKYKFRLYHHVKFSYDATVNPKIRVKRNNSSTILEVIPTAPLALFGTSVDTAFIDLDKDDEIEVYLTTANGTYDTQIVRITLSCIDIDELEVGYAGLWEWSESLPKMSQKDFIKGIALMYGFIFIPDRFHSILHVKQFNDITNNLGKAIDWSEKLDLHTTPTIQYRFGSFGQSNHFKYKEDKNPSWIENTGNGTFAVDDKNLPLNATIVELPFAGTPELPKLESISTPVIQVFDEDEDDNTQLMLTHAAEPRVIMLGRRDLDILNDEYLDYKDEDSSQTIYDNAPLCYFDHPDKDNTLSFDHDLLNTHYATMQQVLNKAKKVTAYFKLTQNDIAELDHFTPIYIEYFGHYFYVNKVHNFVQGKPTKCELIRL